MVWLVDYITGGKECKALNYIMEEIRQIYLMFPFILFYVIYFIQIYV